MADFTADPQGVDLGIQAGKFVNIAAAAVSIALIGGVGVWGYKLLVRDVTGVPVVRALSGEMRVAPENPGGEIASHVGLAVNAVTADGGAAEPEDRLILAPNTTSLQAEDLQVAPREPAMAEAGEVVAVPGGPTASAATLSVDERAPATANTPADPNAPLSADDVLALADQIAAGLSPLTDLSDGQTAPAEIAINGVAVNPDLVAAAVPGVARSLRPAARPANRTAPAALTPARAVTGEVSTTPIAVGTNLVQLGAFDTPDIAATEWARMTQRFPAYFDGKNQIIQKADSGGRTFFRLRAMGFSDLSDARRFCSAMSAEGAACIPVVVR